MNNIDKILIQMQETFYNLTNNRLLLVFGVLWLFLTLIIAYFSYTSYIKPMISEHKLNKEFINKNIDNSEDILVMYFYTEWCPYCKKAKPEWNKFESYVDNKNKSIDYTINLVSINCDESKSIADKYEVDGYPTVKLLYKNKVYDFDAKVTKDSLVGFLDSIK
jgi:thiol-disulfide isomerase/thioredoxin